MNNTPIQSTKLITKFNSFEFYTNTLAAMALESLLHQNKKSSNKILPLMRIDPGKSEILLSELAWLVLLRASLNMPHLIFGHRDLF